MEYTKMTQYKNEGVVSRTATGFAETGFNEPYSPAARRQNTKHAWVLWKEMLQSGVLLG